jgi:hypothetical protein
VRWVCVTIGVCCLPLADHENGKGKETNSLARRSRSAAPVAGISGVKWWLPSLL